MSDARPLTRTARFAPSSLPRPLLLLGLAIAGACLLPVFALVLVAADGDAELWPHLLNYVLPYAARDTFLLLLGVGAGTTFIGTLLASLVSLTNFPGRKIISATAILPLAFPIYLHAFVYVEILDASGPVASFLRQVFGPAAHVPEPRSLWGAIAVFSLVLYPYVYLPLMLAFNAQSANYRDAARTLGYSPIGAFFRVQLPAARPALVAGLVLALMESLADFGASEYLGVRTFAFTIYSTWVSRESLAGAAQIALTLIVIVAVLIAIEAHSRRAASHAMKTTRSNRAARIRLRGAKGWLALAACLAVIATAFVVPAAFILYKALTVSSFASNAGDLLRTLISSVSLAGFGGLFVLLLAITIAILRRWERSNAVSQALGASSLGYAIPGVVLAIGILYASGAIDNAVDSAARAWFGVSTGLIISGTPAILFLAYASRFMAVAHGPVFAHSQQVPGHFDDVARTLGRSPRQVVKDVLIPIMLPTIGSAWLLLVVDIMKELPMTLLLRPIGIETLATSLYGHASRGEFEDGSREALAILLCGIAAVIALLRLIRRGRLRFS